MYDLNVPYPDHAVGAEERRRAMLDTAIKLGYSGIAWNRTVHGRVTQKEISGIEFLSVGVTSGFSEKGVYATCIADGVSRVGCKQYSRITVVLDSATRLHDLTSASQVLSRYDLFAVQPTTENLFRQACSSLEVDIIALDLSGRLPFKIKSGTVKQALERGCYFEISFGGALRDLGTRRYFISNVLGLVRATHGRNIVLSSGACSAMELRSPHDIANLCSLFGMDYASGKMTLSRSCHSALQHGETRKTQRGVLDVAEVVESVERMPEDSSGKRKRVVKN